MARLYTPQTAGVFDGTRPPQQLLPQRHGAKLRAIEAAIDLAALTVTTADEVVLGELPAGAVFAYGVITHSATMGATAALAVGTTGVHATNGTLRAAAVSTAVDAPALFGLSAAQNAAPLTNPTLVFLTVGAANLPGAGRLNILIFYTAPQ